MQDRDGAKLVLARLAGQFPCLRLIWADGGYAGQLIGWAAERWGWTVEIVKRAVGEKRIPCSARWGVLKLCTIKNNLTTPFHR